MKKLVMIFVVIEIFSLIGSHRLRATEHDPLTVAQLAINTVISSYYAMETDWAFTVTSSEINDGNIIHIKRRFDPSRNPLEQWTLLSRDGKIPSEVEQLEFRNKQLELMEEREKAEEKYGGNNIGMYINKDTLKYKSETLHEFLIEFQPKIDYFEAEENEKLSGELVVDKLSGQVKKLTIFNREKFSPHFSVTLDNFKLTVEFIQLKEGLVMQEKQSTITKGRVLFVKEFATETKVTFSKYEKIK